MKTSYAISILWSFVGMHVLATEGSSYSLPDSAELVLSCPVSREEWLERSKKKNCQDSIHSIYPFIYHCVINELGNASIEVCAAPRYILLGQCAEYNFGSMRIQGSDIKNCSMDDPPCPDVYDSTDAVLYQTCYRGSVLDQNAQETAFPQLNITVNTFNESRYIGKYV
ncbi:uncharacterized protein LOC134263499 [Saccostrea cucullata]|uniref:uncharacterized protein LOC134263499 n=1 Tax=Saccostrea cuccullata TaxID=36930 RepID=UPI002ED641C8